MTVFLLSMLACISQVAFCREGKQGCGIHFRHLSPACSMLSGNEGFQPDFMQILHRRWKQRTRTSASLLVSQLKTLTIPILEYTYLKSL